jgi:hemerythrin-like metal-binding protein
MILIWKEHLSVGNAMLDSEHKNLIGMINGLEYKIDHNDVSALLKAIELFKHSARAHFANEARFAQALGLDFEQHDLAHQYLLKELHTTFDELASRAAMPDDTWCKYAMEHYPKLLRDWFIEHITGEDMKMKPVLQSYPCDFKPA